MQIHSFPVRPGEDTEFLREYDICNMGHINVSGNSKCCWKSLRLGKESLGVLDIGTVLH